VSAVRLPSAGVAATAEAALVTGKAGGGLKNDDQHFVACSAMHLRALLFDLWYHRGVVETRGVAA